MSLRTYVTAEADFFRKNGVQAVVTGFTLTALLSSRLAGIPLITEYAGSFVPPVWERKLLEPARTMGLPGARFLPYAAQRWLAERPRPS